MIETDIWPVMKAKYFQAWPKGAHRFVRVIVVHDMEAAERPDTAEAIARYFHEMPDNRQASAHVCVDADSVVQCVHDNDIAYAAPGCNRDGIQIELAGYGSQSRGQWLDTYSDSLLALGANVAAQYCLKYDVPPIHLTDAELKEGSRGIVGHDQVSRAYKQSDHTDPGPWFPWDVFMNRVTKYLAERRARFGVGL
jgi:N-acetyl-anhydromuramyl-L-alanine amidase AmpD